MKTIEITPLRRKINAVVTVPGSKSYTNRSLLLAAMSDKAVKIINPLISNDTEAMINCLKTLGIKILKKNNDIEVLNNIKSIKNLTFNLNANESGTTIRFLLALSTIIPGIKTLYGREGLNNRPIGDLVDALRQLGADIKYLEKKGYPPVKVLSSKLYPGTIKIKGSTSSQFISAILMIAPIVGGVTVETMGEQVSKSFIDMTLDTMSQFGVKIQSGDAKKYIVPAGQKYGITEYVVEGDVSSASYFFAIAVLTKSTITIKNLKSDSKQADMGFLEILKDMGNKIVLGKNQIKIIGKEIKPVNVNMQNCPDQIQTMAILVAFAKGVSKISGISTLRIKETDRVFALRQQLKKMGIKTSATKNVLTIEGGNPKAAIIETYGDHRMAMSFAVAGAKLSGMKISNPDVVNKTFPEFFEKLNSIGIKTSQLNSKNIVLIGMRGSGKTTVAKLLAKKLNKQYIELDDMVVKKVGLTIPEMIKKNGWNFFREKESEIAQEASLQSGKVISTGGGVVTKPENIDALKKNGVFFFLNTSLEKLTKRIGNDSNRPFLTNAKTRQEEIVKLLAERETLYKRAADKIIDTDKLNPSEVVDMIASKLKEEI